MARVLGIGIVGYMVSLAIHCGLGVSEGSWEGTCEGNSAACASVRSEDNTTKTHGQSVGHQTGSVL